MKFPFDKSDFLASEVMCVQTKNICDLPIYANEINISNISFGLCFVLELFFIFILHFLFVYFSFHVDWIQLDVLIYLSFSVGSQVSDASVASVLPHSTHTYVQ